MTENFDLIAKWFIALTGLISVLIKFSESTSITRRKSNLRTDLDLLDKIEKNDIENQELLRIKAKRKKVLNEYLEIEETSLKWFDIFYALILFVGFGWWTIYIYEINSNFSPWTIVTGLISFIGLALLLDNKWRKKSDEKVLIHIIVLRDIKTAVIFIGLSILIGFFIFQKHEGYTHWYILIGIMIPIGLTALFDSIRIKH